MRALVTGAAGFIGRHVVMLLVEEGVDVTGYDVRGPIAEDIRWCIGDLRDREMLRSAATGQDVILHVGAVGDVYLAAEDPSLASAVNVTGSANVAAAAAAVDAKVVYASTWEVYGSPIYEPIDENHPCRPDHPYNITKHAGEQMLLASGRLRDIPVVSLRLGTAYGVGLRPNSVFRIFIDKARRGEPITILGDGSQERQFTQAKDIARAFSRAARRDLRDIVVNVVAPETISIGKLATLITERFPAQIEFRPARPGDITPARVSADRARALLDWVPGVSFEQGLAELLDEDPTTP